jgi:hypothetical protein
VTTQVDVGETPPSVTCGGADASSFAEVDVELAEGDAAFGAPPFAEAEVDASDEHATTPRDATDANAIQPSTR